MPRPRFDKLPADKQEAILQAATAEFAEHGWRAASLNRIIRACGVSKGAMYYYFDDKLDLFATVVDRVMLSAMSAAPMDTQAMTAETFWPLMTHLGHSTLEGAKAQPHVMGLGRAYLELDERERERAPVAAVLEDIHSWLERILARGQAVGVVRADMPARVLAEAWRALDQVFEQWAMAELGDDVDSDGWRSFVATMVDLMRRLLLPPESLSLPVIPAVDLASLAPASPEPPAFPEPPAPPETKD